MSRSNATRSETDGRPSSRPARIAQLVVALTCDRPLEPARAIELAGVSEIWLGRAPPEAPPGVLRLSFPDERMSALHARLRRVLGRWVVEDAGSKNGVRVQGTAQLRAVLNPGDSIECGQTFLVFDEHDRGEPSPPALPPGAAELGCQSFHPDLLAAWSALARVAPTRVPVMLQGETGTGKELAARALHVWSGRAGPFVAVNCGALPEQLAESELFGVRRGAFTGAVEDRPGLVRASSGGTLLLDEVGELPAGLQVKLLRVLQENEVQPVGAAQPVRVDLRVVTATHRDLASLVEEGTFRSDLFARLTGFEVELPPLRDRRSDLGLLVPTLLRRAGAPAGIRFSREAARALFRWTWPHNVRELEKALALGVALAADGRIELAHLPEPVRSAPELRPDPMAGRTARPLSEADVTRRTELIELLRAHHGNVSAVARQMGVARMQVQRWCRRFHLDPASFRAA
ncbi:MAG TPA: sigma 54-interacting transcriptional regulator [Myxococcaceae bacterium]|nr:sigma 54-interacting transcriptional regulator [Myxococcaceae bacterium]